MMEGNKVIRYEAFISYLDIDGRIIEGWFTIVGDNGWAIRFETTNRNVLTVPHARVLRLKEKGDKNEGIRI